VWSDEICTEVSSSSHRVNINITIKIISMKGGEFFD
jgi:hypothetical protein